MAGAYLSSIGAIVFANIMIAIQLSDQINQMIVATSVLKMFVDEYAVYEKRVFEIVDSVLRMEQVCFSYDKKEVLHDISFAIQKIRKLELLEKVAVENQRL